MFTKSADPFRLPGDIQFAMHEMHISRDLLEKAKAAARDTAARYNEQHSVTPIGAVHEAEAAVEAASLRYGKARVSLRQAREAFGVKFLAAIAPTSESLHGDVAEIAERLATAVELPLRVDDHASNNQLPLTRQISRARRLSELARELKTLAE